MPRPTRRAVTGHDASGKAIVLIDGAAPNAQLRKATGLTSTLLCPEGPGCRRSFPISR